MTHQSNYPNIYWHIDNIHLLKNDMCEISGWIFCEDGIIQSLSIGNNIYSFDYYGHIRREDVKMVYPKAPDNELGFKINVPSNLLNTPISINIESTQYNDIGILNSWLVYNSGINNKSSLNIIVVDDFYSNPDLIRDFAINNLNFNSSDYHKGMRSSESFILNGTKEKFEQIIGKSIVNWNNPSYANGKFQFCTSLDSIVYHTDIQSYAAMVFLTPNAPLQSGTATYKSIYTNSIKIDSDETHTKTFKGLSNDLNFYDKTSFEVVDSIGNIYNRLIIFDSKNIHAAVNYFGDSIENSRFFHLFFFDIL
jgi:hypothetical protein